jgi:predicted aspartyl protease
MFNILLALVAGILIGWNFHSFFIALNPPKILRSDFNLSSKPTIEVHSKVESNSGIEKSETNQTIKKNTPLTFNSLLKNNLFSDAMRLYIKSEDKKKSIYRDQLESFFQRKIFRNKKEAISQLNEYLEIEPKNIETKLQLIEAYQKVEEFDKALEILITLLNNSESAVEQEQYHKEIIKISQIYIDKLINDEKFQQLIAFLEIYIEYEFNTTFYTFTLAKHYVDTKEYPLAEKLLKEIEFDEEYGERAKTLLKKIKNKKSSEEEYRYKFPLIKEGEHFLIEVNIDEIPLKLLLDTGASYSLINENKLSSLTIIEEEITLQTPTGNIISKLQQAQSFKIEELEIKEFKLISLPFKQQNADGLLGMNFFKKFQFKIDQEKGILYLLKKKTRKEPQ